MIEAMKGGDNGIISRNDPIVPVDFDIEIDGIAGIYPGNAFQSSYLPTRYKEMACFQAMGVDHKVDSSGWTSTIKGQIRVSIESQIDEDKIDKEEEFEETKDWTPPESPGNPNIPFPINLDLDILGELNTDGFDLDLEVGASYENTDEEPPPYVSSGVGEDMELRMTDEQGEAGYVGGREVGPSMDADFSSFDMRRAADDNDWPGAVPQPYIEGPHEFMFGERAWNTGALPNSVVEVAGTARTIVNQATNILTLGNHLANQYPNMTWEWTSNESGWQNLYIDGILSVDDNLTDWIRAGATAHDWYNAWVISKVNYSGD
jgi:hypothetical protein